jgi:CO/xanthine dehydrogenase FAD-binding subunit
MAALAAVEALVVGAGASGIASAAARGRGRLTVCTVHRVAVVIPRSLPEALAALDAHPDALVLAGGTDVMVELNEGRRRLAGDDAVVVVNRIPELRTWTVDRQAAVVRIGAGVTYAELAGPPLADLLPALGHAARTVGSPQIRSAATIGGNLGTCSPAGDGLPVLAALDATVDLVGAAGARSLPFGDFMVGAKRSARQPGELITAVTVPRLEGWQGYSKVGVRNAMVIAISGACLAVDETTRSVRLALGSVAPTIVRAPEAESLAADAVDWPGRAVAEGAVQEFGRRAAGAARPIDDHRASAAYRRHSIEVLARRLLRRAFPVEGAA